MFEARTEEEESLIAMAEDQSKFATVEEAIAQFSAGRMIVVVDDEDRENETGAGTACTGLGIAAAPRQGNGEGSSTFASGSVPIDIVVRPSSSWVGSLGVGSMGRQSSFVP